MCILQEQCNRSNSAEAMADGSAGLWGVVADAAFGGRFAHSPGKCWQLGDCRWQPPPVSRAVTPRSAGGRTAGALAPAGDDPVCYAGALPHVRRRAAAGEGGALGVCSPKPPAR